MDALIGITCIGTTDELYTYLRVVAADMSEFYRQVGNADNLGGILSEFSVFPSAAGK